MSRGRRAIIATLVLLAVGLWWWLARPLPPRMLEGPPPVGEHIEPDLRSPGRVPPNGEPPSEGGCSSERKLMQVATAAAAGECAEELAASGCVPPVPFPHTHQPPASWRAWFASTFASCDQSGLALDCSEFPCLLLVRRDHLDPPSCDALKPYASSAMPPGELGPGWEDWAPFDTENIAEPNGPVAARVHSRAQYRVAHLGQRLGTESHTLDLTHSCEEVRATLDRMSGSGACETLREHWGCGDGELALDIDHYREVVGRAQALADDLLSDCPNPALDTAIVDCSALPCVLLWAANVEERATDETCNALPAADGRQFYTLRFPPAPTLRLVPLFSTAPTEMEEAVRDRWENERHWRQLVARQRWTDLQAVDEPR